MSNDPYSQPGTGCSNQHVQPGTGCSNQYFQLNGQRVSLSDPRESLLRWLKRQGLSGTKEGCADGDCGACTVAMVEVGPDGQSRFQAMNSCLLPMGSMPGREVITVEALAEPQALHPVQQAMVDCAGSQCGYCTPGFVMSLFTGYYQGALDESCIEGNLCRCTGYLPIRAAASKLEAETAVPDRFHTLLAEPRSALPAGALAEYFSPSTLADALALKQTHPQARWICGATDLGVNLSRGETLAPAFIALDRITELQQLEVSDRAVRIGAAVSLSRLEHELAGVFPALDGMLPWFAARQVRNRATLGGNLGSASPIGDLLPILLALDAVVHCAGLNGARDLPIADYFLGYRKTALATDEIITSVTLPRHPLRRNASYKVAKRQTDDISIVAAVFALELDAEQRVAWIRLAYGGVAATPIRAVQSEAFLLGRTLDADTVQQARARLSAEFTPLSDHRASAEYRRQLCGNLFAQFVSEHVVAEHGQ